MNILKISSLMAISSAVAEIKTFVQGSFRHYGLPSLRRVGCQLHPHWNARAAPYTGVMLTTS
jgi:hypothetical protein